MKDKEPLAKIAPLTEFTLDQANTRKHPDRNKATIRASLEQFGAGRSIVADRDNVIRAGNGTLEQAIEAGMEALVVEPKPNQLVVVKRPDWSPTQAIAYAVADNRATDQSENDDAALASVLRGLQSEDFDLAAVGFDDAEVDALIEGLASSVPEGEWADAIGGLPDGDKSPFQSMTFTLTNDQAEVVKRAIEAAKDAGPFVETGNENSNGNALSRICESYV